MRFLRRHWSCAMLLFLLPAFLFAGGAGEPEAGAAEATEVVWWATASEEWTEEAQRSMVENFHAAHPEVRVDMVLMPGEGFHDKMTVTLGAGEGAPDVAHFWTSDWFPQAEDLRPYISRDNFDTGIYYQGFYKDWCQPFDEIVGLPLGVGASIVMYNKDIFDKAGVAYPKWDWTTEDYLDVAVKVTDKPNKIWGCDQLRDSFRAIWFSYGARPYSDDSKVVDGYLNGPESVAAYTWFWDLMNSGAPIGKADLETLSDAWGTGPVALFNNGRIGMATLNQGHMLNSAAKGVNFGVLPEPRAPGGQLYMHGWTIVCSIWKGSQVKDAAWTFLKYWNGPEGQRHLMENATHIPSIPDVLKDHPAKNEQYTQDFFKILELPGTANWLMTHPAHRAAIKGIQQDVWDRIILQKIERDEIKAALDALIPAAEEALAEAVARLGG